MHTLLRNYYDGEILRDTFIRTEDYKQLQQKEKRQWLNDKLNLYQQWLQRAYKRPHTKPISEAFIEKLWETKRKAMKANGKPRLGYQLPDGSTITEKENFVNWIRQIFNAPLHIRTKEFPWENKALPDIPVEVQEPVHQIIQTKSETSEIGMPWKQESHSQQKQKFESLKEEYSFVKKSSIDELRQIYPKMERNEILKEIEEEAKVKGIILRSRSRSYSRSRSRRRNPRPRSRSYSRSRSRGRNLRPRSRSYSRSRSQPKSILKGVNVVTTRAQQRRLGDGQRVTPSQIPRRLPQVIASPPPQMRIRTGRQGQLIGSPFSDISRRYSRTPSPFRTPSRSPGRGTNDPPSLPISRQQTPISRQSSVSSNSRTTTPSWAQSARSGDIISRIPTPVPSRPSSRSSSRSRSSSIGPQLIPTWIANSGLVINGEINGFRLQIIFSTIHKTDWMTQETAQRCGIGGQLIPGDHYLENTYMDHRYNQRTRNAIDILIGQINGNSVYITTSDVVPIVRTDNFYHRSESLRNQRNRYFFLVGMDTIQSNNIVIRADKLQILIPNPDYQQAVRKKYYQIKAMQYPDLSEQRNREFNIHSIIKAED